MTLSQSNGQSILLRIGRWKLQGRIQLDNAWQAKTIFPQIIIVYKLTFNPFAWRYSLTSFILKIR